MGYSRFDGCEGVQSYARRWLHLWLHFRERGQFVQEVIILRGLPGSGKTTWAREYCKEHTEFRRVSKDDIRAMLGAEFSTENEDAVCNIRDRIIQVLIGHLFSVVVDDTNISKHHVMRISGMCTRWDTRSRVMDFKTPMNECIARDAARPNPVGEDVIRKMAEQWNA